jgi:hypothetical protein
VGLLALESIVVVIPAFMVEEPAAPLNFLEFLLPFEVVAYMLALFDSGACCLVEVELTEPLGLLLLMFEFF